MKKNRSKVPPARTATPPEREIRDYAYHLFEQNGRIPGRDLENWLEAEACLKACIPAHRSHGRLHRYLRGLGPAMQEELCETSAEGRNLIN